MRSVFVYYSLSGNGDYLAEQLAKEGVDSIKLMPKHSLPKAMFLKMMFGGMFALFHKKPKLTVTTFDLSGYDQVILGTPIWNGRCATPVNTFLKHNSLKDKKVVVLAYSGGGDAGKCQEEISKLYDIEQFISLREPLKNQKDASVALNEIVR